MTNPTQQIKINGELYHKDNLDKLFRFFESDELWLKAIVDFLKNWFDDSDFISVQTSGSTGKPKTIQLPKQSMINSARMTNEYFALDKNKTALLCLPASYIAGKMMLVRAMVGGFNLICIEPASNPFSNVFVDIDFAAITPHQLQYSLDSLKNKKVKNIIVGGGQVNSSLETLLAAVTVNFYETYGMTETASHIALRSLNGSGKSDYFTVLQGVSVQQDERGCLVIDAPHLHENKIITNDIVELQTEKSFRWLGRYDSVINSGAVKIHPEQVEKKLEGILSNYYFISSQPDKVLGNKVVLVIESKVFTMRQIEELKITLQSVLNKYEMPKLILFIPAFVYSESAKLLRAETLKKESVVVSL